VEGAAGPDIIGLLGTIGTWLFGAAGIAVAILFRPRDPRPADPEAGTLSAGSPAPGSGPRPGSGPAPAPGPTRRVTGPQGRCKLRDWRGHHCVLECCCRSNGKGRPKAEWGSPPVGVPGEHRDVGSRGRPVVVFFRGKTGTCR
jgi:hypothetical protein